LPSFDAPAQRASSKGEGGSALRLGLSGEQIGQTFGFRQIHASIRERSAGELAGLRASEALYAPERVKDGGHDGTAAMQMQLGNIFSGSAVRAWEEENHSLIK
jgi:hypothetical protein